MRGRAARPWYAPLSSNCGTSPRSAGSRRSMSTALTAWPVSMCIRCSCWMNLRGSVCASSSSIRRTTRFHEAIAAVGGMHLLRTSSRSNNWPMRSARVPWTTHGCKRGIPSTACNAPHLTAQVVTARLAV
jgi:hypothetical protein